MEIYSNKHVNVTLDIIDTTPTDDEIECYVEWADRKIDKVIESAREKESCRWQIYDDGPLDEMAIEAIDEAGQSAFENMDWGSISWDRYNQER